MGMPLSAVTYDVLRALASGRRRASRDVTHYGRAPMREALHAMLEHVPVTALVLYDPIVHRTFAERLAENFRHLDALTSESVVFFALVDDPTIAQHATYRERHDQLHEWLRDAHLHVRPRSHRAHALEEQRVSDATIAMALAADIPYAALPCVMFTTDIDADTWGWVSVDPSTLVPTFDLLVQLAQASLPGMLVDPKRLAEFVALSLGPPGYTHERRLRLRWPPEAREERYAAPHGETHARRRLAQSLADVLACHGNQDGPEYGWPARLRRGHTAADAPEDDELCLTGLLQMANAPRYDAFASSTPLLPSLPDASAALRTGMFLLAKVPAALDMGAAAVSLGKGIEIVINATAIQLLRREHGVSMPPHFRTYDRQRGRLALRLECWPDTTVDINAKEREMPWRPLTLATAVAVLTEHGREALTHAAAREVVELARTIAPTRNAAAHWKVMTRRDVKELADAVQAGVERGLLRELEQLVAPFREDNSAG